ncbi:hypothetical protein ACS0PU_012068 [Formica fusca]
MFSTPLLAAIRSRRWKAHHGFTSNVSRSVVQSFGNIGSRGINRREITVDRRRISPLIDYIDRSSCCTTATFFVVSLRNRKEDCVVTSRVDGMN